MESRVGFEVEAIRFRFLLALWTVSGRKDEGRRGYGRWKEVFREDIVGENGGFGYGVGEIWSLKTGHGVGC